MSGQGSSGQRSCKRLRSSVSSFTSALVKPHWKHSVQFWVPQYKRDVDILESPTKGHKNVEGTGASFSRGKAQRA